MSHLPTYALVGLFVMVLSEVAMLRRVEPFWTWHTPVAWTGYVLFVDGLVFKRRGHSWLKSARGEFVFLAVVSVPLWLVFEFYNLFLQNWRYEGLPPPPWRWVGYVWSFATIWPAIFETGDLLASFGEASRSSGRAPVPSGAGPPDGIAPGPKRPVGPRGPARGSRGAAGWRSSTSALTSVLFGTLCLTVPLLWPSRHLAAPVWLGFIFLLDPINRWLGAESLGEDLAKGNRHRLTRLMLAGLLCGLLWEFWNFWARAKWVYDVPIFPQYRLFEMPVAGYLGFPAFALECFTLYVFVRHWLWRGPCRPLSL